MKPGITLIQGSQACSRCSLNLGLGHGFLRRSKQQNDKKSQRWVDLPHPHPSTANRSDTAAARRHAHPLACQRFRIADSILSLACHRRTVQSDTRSLIVTVISIGEHPSELLGDKPSADRALEFE